MNLADARRKCESWRIDYNNHRTQLAWLPGAGGVDVELKADQPTLSSSGGIFSRQMVQETGQAHIASRSHSSWCGLKGAGQNSRQEMTNQRGNVPRRLTVSAHRLYRALFAPFADSLGGIDHLIAIFDRDMEHLPPSLFLRSAAPTADYGLFRIEAADEAFAPFRKLDFLARHLSLSPCRRSARSRR
ncbi:MAG: hypothetical protein R3F54_27365 [Alphaproteobacteria bacterium]